MALFPESEGKSKYFITFIDDFSCRISTYLMHTKDEAFEHFKHYVAKSERQTGERVKRIQSDNGLEYKSVDFKFITKIKA